MLRASFMLATLPMIVFAVAGTSKPQPIVPIAITTEGVTARRLDDNTFSHRWHPINAMPPAIEIHEVRYVPDVVSAVSGAAVSAPQPVMPSRHRLRTRPVRLDICRAHNMHRVMVGKYKWRCRK